MDSRNDTAFKQAKEEVRNVVITATMHFIGRVTLFFANNSLTECRVTIEFLHYFLEPEVPNF